MPSSLQNPGYGDDYRHTWELSAQRSNAQFGKRSPLWAGDGWGACPFPGSSGINVTSREGRTVPLQLSLEGVHALGTRCLLSSVVSYGNIQLQTASARQYQRDFGCIFPISVYIPARLAQRPRLVHHPAYNPDPS